MKETPIIMSGNHPQLILDGIKTQTRRTYGLKEINKDSDNWKLVWFNPRTDIAKFSKGKVVNGMFEITEAIAKCPYGQVGDSLWVRETHFIGGIKPNEWVSYRADARPKDLELYVWRPSIFMPRWASRILLEISKVRVERVQDISEADALAEGIKISQGTWQDTERDKASGSIKVVGEPQPYTARYHFEALWDDLNSKKHPWESNPWVWVITFKEIK